MSHRFAVGLGAIALVLALPMAAQAGSWTVSAGGGTSIPTGDFADESLGNAGIGVQFGSAVDYRFNPMFAVGLDGSWNRNASEFEGKTVDYGLTQDRFDVNRFDTWQLGAHGMYFVPVAGSVSPYVIAGVDIYNTTQKIERANTAGGVTTSFAEEVKTGSRLGAKGGIGAIFNLNDALGVGVEGNYNYISQDTGKVKVESLTYIGVTAMLVFNLMR